MLERKAAEAEAERGEINQSVRKSHDIPFGIRALLEDPEVEGVWNSRTNTPLRCHTPQKHGSVASLHPRNPPKYTPSSSSNAKPSTVDLELAAPNGMIMDLDVVFTDIVKIGGHSETELRKLMEARTLEVTARSLSSTIKDLTFDQILQATWV